MPGNTELARCRELFLLIQIFYKANDVESRLDHLFPNMLCQKKKSPKLRAKAAEARGLVPFARDAAVRYLLDTDPAEHAAKQAAIQLASCYDCLSHAAFDHDLLRASCRRFCLLTVALEATDSKLWRVKPKMHLFQEMCEMQASCPTDSWTYRDEDFGGTLAKISRKRGGLSSAMSTAKGVLQRFAAKHVLPSII